MARLPAYCPSCGTAFYSSFHSLGPNANVEIHGVGIRCPNPICGEMAQMVDGQYDVADRKTRLLSGPPFSRAVLEQLEEIARRAQAQEITPEDAVRAAKQVDPRLADLLDKFLTVGLAAVAAFLAFLSWQIQNSAFELQQEDSEASSQFYREALQLLERQALAAEKQQDSRGIDDEGDRPPTARPYKKPTSKKTSNRRRDVNKARREALKQRRMAFPRRPHRRTP